LATSRDRYLATSGDFFMATDIVAYGCPVKHFGRPRETRTHNPRIKRATLRAFFGLSRQRE
jgi:hypothetical protein